MIGSGYVGLVTGSCLAEIGHEVICTDSDAAKIQMLESGELPIYEPGLDEVVAKVRREKRLTFSREPRGIGGGRAMPFSSAWGRRRCRTGKRI